MHFAFIPESLVPSQAPSFSLHISPFHSFFLGFFLLCCSFHVEFNQSQVFPFLYSFFFPSSHFLGFILHFPMALIYMPVTPNLQLYRRLYSWSLDLYSQLSLYHFFFFWIAHRHSRLNKFSPYQQPFPLPVLLLLVSSATISLFVQVKN